MTSTHHWASFHTVLFPDPVAGLDHNFDRPDGPEVWRFLPSQVMGEDGLPTLVSNLWGAMAFHSTREAAQDAFDRPETLMPWLGDTIESWHMIALPFAHHGEVNWSGSVSTDGSAIRIGKAARGGPVAVATSAGYVDPGPDDLPRIRAFAAGVEAARASHGAARGNRASDVFNGGRIDGMEGFTLTLWEDDRSMIASAYKPGTHRSEMDRHEAETLFDRSSFSRFRPLASRGSWNGADPLHGLLN